MKIAALLQRRARDSPLAIFVFHSSTGLYSQHARGNLRAVIQRDLVTVVARNGAIELYFDAALGKLLFGITSEGWTEFGQKAVAWMDQDDSCKPLTQLGIEFYRAENQVVQSAGRFCTGKTATGNDNCECFLRSASSA